MSHTNSTTNYGLPQFIPTDKPFWLTDINGAFSTIDTAIDAAKDAADNAQGDATQALTDAGNATTTANTAKTEADGAIDSLAPAFSTSSPYFVGDIVMYNNLIYICTSDVSVPGPWTGPTNWDRITVGDKIETLTDYTKYSSTEKIIGTWIDGKPIYRKVITGTVLTTGVLTSILTGTYTDTIINFDVHVNDPSKNLWFEAPMRFEEGTNWYQLYTFVTQGIPKNADQTSVVVNANSSNSTYWDGCIATLIIDYTKP